MTQTNSSIIRNAKAVVLLLAVFLMMVNTCPVRSLLNSAFAQSVETPRQQGTATIVYDDLRCSESKLAKVTFIEFSKSANSSLALPLFLTVISLYLSLPIISAAPVPLRRWRRPTLTERIPLFLKNRSIII